MTDLILIIVLAIILGFAVYKTSKRVTGKETSCGTKEHITGNKIKNSIGTKTIHIEGMH